MSSIERAHEIHHPIYGRVKVFDENDHISQIVMTGHEWEGPIADLMAQYFKAGTDFVDIGANLGFSTLSLVHRLARHQRSPAMIHCFEPQPDVCALLSFNLRGLPSTKIYNVALGDKPQVISYTQVTNNIGGTQLNHVGNRNYCATIPLDYLDITKNPVSLVKMDVEMHELYTIEGAREFLTKHRPVLFLEVHAHLVARVTDRLKHLGFRLREKIPGTGYDFIYEPI